MIGGTHIPGNMTLQSPQYVMSRSKSPFLRPFEPSFAEDFPQKKNITPKPIASSPNDGTPAPSWSKRREHGHLSTADRTGALVDRSPWSVYALRSLGSS